jgi:multimeric flavodoxin WrbA
MLPLLEPMGRSKIWVLGTPVYWWGPTAQMKLFVDRWFGARHTIPFAGRHVILVIPLGDTDVRTARHVEGMFQDSLDYLNMEHLTTVLGPGVDGRGEISEHPAVMEAANQAGREAVR